MKNTIKSINTLGKYIVNATEFTVNSIKLTKNSHTLINSKLSSILNRPTSID